MSSDTDLQQRARAFAAEGRAQHELASQDECATIELRDIPPPGDRDALVRVLARMLIAALRVNAKKQQRAA